MIPTYTLTDAIGGIKETNPVQQYGLFDGNYFYLYSSDPTGTWTIDESIDLGPYGGGKTGSGSFGVYSTTEHPLTNDLVTSAMTIPGMPVNLVQDTMGSTLSSGDPSLLGCLSFYTYYIPAGLASVWYKYQPSQDGMLNLDTLGSDYDTAVAVYQGTPSVSTRKACNDDIAMDPDWNSASQLSVGVKAGTTYYIEVVDTGFTEYKIPAGASPCRRGRPAEQAMWTLNPLVETCI